MKKPLNLIKPLIVLIFTAAIFCGCSKEKPRTEFVARVNDSYLTSEDLENDLDTTYLQKSRRDEYIRNWIENEVFYKEALDENINDDEDFLRAVEKNRKELAKAFLIRKLTKEKDFKIEKQELEDFFINSRRNFELFVDHYLFNIITFSDEDKAILFRSTLIESDWNKALNVFKGDPSIVYVKEKEFLDLNQINPTSVLVTLQELLPDEVSIVINTDPDKFTVLQLIKKYNPGDIPELDVIKNRVVERLTMIKTQMFIKDYLKELYGKYKIEIK